MTSVMPKAPQSASALAAEVSLISPSSNSRRPHKILSRRKLPRLQSPLPQIQIHRQSKRNPNQTKSSGNNPPTPDLHPRRLHPNKHPQNQPRNQNIRNKKQTNPVGSQLRKKKPRIKPILKQPRNKLRIRNRHAKQTKQQINIFAPHPTPAAKRLDFFSTSTVMQSKRFQPRSAGVPPAPPSAIVRNNRKPARPHSQNQIFVFEFESRRRNREKAALLLRQMPRLQPRLQRPQNRIPCNHPHNMLAIQNRHLINVFPLHPLQNTKHRLSRLRPMKLIQRHHSRLHRSIRPILPRHRPRRIQSNQPHRNLPIIHNVAPSPSTQNLLHIILDRILPPNRRNILSHHVPSPNPGKRRANRNLRITLLRRIPQKPSNERQPQSANLIPSNKLRDPAKYHQICNHLSGASRITRSLRKIIGNTPDQSPKNSPAIQRKSRHQIKSRQNKINFREPGSGSNHHLASPRNSRHQ